MTHPRVLRKSHYRLLQLPAMLMLLSTMAIGQQLEPIGIFTHHQDVGNPKLRGSATYNPADQTYRVKAAGANMWANNDQFHFLWKQIKGDFIMQARVQWIGEGTADHRKLGIIVRDNLNPDSRYVDACVHGDTLTALQYREQNGGQSFQDVMYSHHPTEIQLERKGNVYTFSAAVFGERYKTISRTMELGEEPYVGLFLCSHVEDVYEEAVFSNVRIIIPAADNFVPYRDYIGSHLEVMDIKTGHRKIIHTSKNSLQAPNWSEDGKLIYMEGGRLNYFDLNTGEIKNLNTGPIQSSNNDKVISFDGKQMAFSASAGSPRRSTIFVMPIAGSDNPVQVTSSANHSYLHGWSPDGTKLIFHGNRNNQWDIWQIDVNTKEEVNLTNSRYLDDGPEYTPDGKWIYYNSTQSGTMQIWRMKPDGTGHQQITFDQYNNWFPHISPDGKWIVYLAFPPDIDPKTHPFYKRVYIMLMPTNDAGAPKAIGYVYGGQGTINVPSWSHDPDNLQISFVSNTQILDE